jgi:hypothetical protein
VSSSLSSPSPSTSSGISSPSLLAFAISPFYAEPFFFFPFLDFFDFVFKPFSSSMRCCFIISSISDSYKFSKSLTFDAGPADSCD